MEEANVVPPQNFDVDKSDDANLGPFPQACKSCGDVYLKSIKEYREHTGGRKHQKRLLANLQGSTEEAEGKAKRAKEEREERLKRAKEEKEERLKRTKEKVNETLKRTKEKVSETMKRIKEFPQDCDICGGIYLDSYKMYVEHAKNPDHVQRLNNLKSRIGTVLCQQKVPAVTRKAILRNIRYFKKSEIAVIDSNLAEIVMNALSSEVIHSKVQENENNAYHQYQNYPSEYFQDKNLSNSSSNFLSFNQSGNWWNNSHSTNQRQGGSNYWSYGYSQRFRYPSGRIVSNSMYVEPYYKSPYSNEHWENKNVYETSENCNKPSSTEQTVIENYESDRILNISIENETARDLKMEKAFRSRNNNRKVTFADERSKNDSLKKLKSDVAGINNNGQESKSVSNNEQKELFRPLNHDLKLQDDKLLNDVVKKEVDEKLENLNALLVKNENQISASVDNEDDLQKTPSSHFVNSSDTCFQNTKKFSASKGGLSSLAFNRMNARFLSLAKTGKMPNPETIRHMFFLSSDSEDDDSKKINSKENASDSACELNVNNYNSSLDSPWDSKLQTWSKTLEEKQPEVSECNKEIISKLINFPRSRNEQMALKCLLQKHSKSRKKLTLPRFNMQLKDNEPSKNTNIDHDMNQMVTEAVGKLPDDVLTSFLNVLNSDNEEAFSGPCTFPDSPENEKQWSAISVREVPPDKTKPSQSESSDTFKMPNSTCFTEDAKNANDSRTLPVNETGKSFGQKRKLGSPFSSSIFLMRKKAFVNSENKNTSPEEKDTVNDASEFPSATINSDKEMLVLPETTVDKHPDKIDISEANASFPVRIKTEPKSPPGEFSEAYMNLQNNLLGTSSANNNNGLQNMDMQDSAPPDEKKTPNKDCDNNLSFSSLIDLFASGAVKVKSEFDDPAFKNLDLSSLSETLSVSSAPIKIEVPVETIVSPNEIINLASPRKSAAKMNLPTVIEKEASVSETNKIPEVSSSTDIVNHKESLGESSVDFRAVYQNSSVLSNSKDAQELVGKLVHFTECEESLQKEFAEADRMIAHLTAELEKYKNKRIELVRKESSLRAERMLILHKLQESFPLGKSCKESEKNNSSKKEEVKKPQSVTKDKPLDICTIKNRMSTIKKPSCTKKLSNIAQMREIFQDHVTSSSAKPKRTIALKGNKKFKIRNSSEKSKKALSTFATNSHGDAFSSNVRKTSAKTPVNKVNINMPNNPAFPVSKGSYNYTKQCEVRLQKLQRAIPFKHKVLQSSNMDVKIKRMELHSISVTCMTVFDGFLYTCSSDKTAKRIKLNDPSNITVYPGHTKHVTALFATKSLYDVLLYTVCSDGYLRCFFANVGVLRNQVCLNHSILCMCEGWGTLYLGLLNGEIALYNLSLEKQLESMQCAKSSVSCISTTTQGAQRLLCIATFDGVVTIWDASTKLLLRCLECRIKPPCYIRMLGNCVFVSTAEKTVVVHEVLSGKMEYMLKIPQPATGLEVTEDYIISSSYDGLVRIYSKEKKCRLLCQYYGADKKMVMCMTIFEDWIITGNRNGIVDSFKFDPNKIFFCKFTKCDQPFGRTEDLEYHVVSEHFRTMNKNLKFCPWRECSYSFSATYTEQERKDHISHHLTDKDEDLEEVVIINPE